MSARKTSHNIVQKMFSDHLLSPHFFDADRREVSLKPGKTWVQVVPTD